MFIKIGHMLNHKESIIICWVVLAENELKMFLHTVGGGQWILLARPPHYLRGSAHFKWHQAVWVSFTTVLSFMPLQAEILADSEEVIIHLTSRFGLRVFFLSLRRQFIVPLHWEDFLVMQSCDALLSMPNIVLITLYFIIIFLTQD